ncbi:MFS transporter [Planosporangium thailandense]|uniref:MFS transporter n=1 Tax=Planosporangium thailandense TaxID=765197 RepID=UPI00197C0B93
MTRTRREPPAPTTAGSRGWLSRNLLVLSGVSFLQDAASELLYPIMPIFLTAVLGAPAAVVGLVEGLAEGAAALTKLAAGGLGDRYRRRPLIAAGYGLAAVGKVLIALAVVWPVVLAGRVVDRLGKGMRGAPRDALLVDGIPPAARGRAFGLHRTADTLGAVVGPLIGLAGYELLHHRIRPLLAIAVVPAVLSVLLVAAVRERTRPPAGAKARPTLRGANRLPARFWRIMAVLAAFALVNFPDALLLLRLRAIGFSVTALILAYVTYNLVYAAASYPAGLLADRWRPPRVFGLGLIFFAVGYVGLGLVHSHPAAWALLAAYGLFTACTDGVGKAWISGLVGADFQARAQGVYQALSGFGVLVAGIWAGLAWRGDGRLPLILSGTAAAILAAVLLAASSRRARDRHAAPHRALDSRA